MSLYQLQTWFNLETNRNELAAITIFSYFHGIMLYWIGKNIHLQLNGTLIDLIQLYVFSIQQEVN